MHVNPLTLALGLATSITPASAFFRMSCPGSLVRERIDPIVNPGGVSGHVHTISGGSGFAPTMDFAQARASKCSSCQIKEDFSNYWTPQLYIKAKNGSFFPVPRKGGDLDGGMTVYYLQRGEKGEKLKAFPEGFRMLAGDSNKRNFTGGLDAQAIRYACLDSGKGETTNIPNYKCPGGLRAQVFFPSCWNGQNATDNKSHMSYPAGEHFDSGPCPSSHPIHLVSIFYEILYETKQFDNEWDGDKHPFVFSNGDTTGYGFHGDFFNGWNVDVLQKAVDTCTADSGRVEDCGAVTMYTDSECKACRLPSVVNEQVDGILSQLPGCNPITSGPGPAVSDPTCPKTGISAPEPEYVDLTSSKKWQYVGCGVDNYYDRTFTATNTNSNDMTVEKCVDYCSSKGFKYAGLEYSKECYCDNTLKQDRAPKPGVMGSCTTHKCAGNNKENCGGAGALSIYSKCGGTCQNNQIGGDSSSSAGNSAHAKRRLHSRDITI